MTEFSIIDLVLLGGVALLVGIGLYRGLSGELASFAAFVAALAAGVADFVLGLIVFGLVRWLVNKFVSFLVPQPTNALLGALSGLVKSVAACFLLSGIAFMRPGTYVQGCLAQRSLIIHTFAEWADSYSANRSEASPGTEG